MSKKNRDEGSFVQVGYDVLDLISYNGVVIDSHMKLILSMARSYQRSGNVYYESNPTLQLRLGLGKDTVRKTIKKLETAGLMQVERIDGVGNKYYPLPFDLALAVFIPEKGAPRDILREQPVEQEPTEQGPADEHANDCPVVGSSVGTAPDIDTTSFTAAFAADIEIDDAFAIGIPEAQPVEPATSEAWLDAPFTPQGELIPEAVQYCIEHGLTDPEEQKEYVRELVVPNYVREKPIYNPTPATASEPEGIPF